MKPWILAITVMLGLALPATAQTGKPVVWVKSMDDLKARRPSVPGEVVNVQNLRTNSNLPGWPRSFWEYSRTVVTNDHDGVHYSTNATPGSIYASSDRGDYEQNAAWWGAIGDAATDNTVALNSAASYVARYIEESAFTTLKGQGYGTLVIPPSSKSYLVTNTVNVQSSLKARGAALTYRGPTNTAYNPLLIAPASPTTTFINNHRFELPDVWGWDRGFDHTNSVGIRVRSIGRSTFVFPYVYRFHTGVEFLCDTEAVTLNTFEGGFIDTCRMGVSAVATNNGYFNGNTWYGLRVNLENLNFRPGTTNGHEVIRIASYGGSINGNTWYGGSWEGFPGQRLIYITNASANLFTGMRLEHHVSDYTNVVASSLYMEVDSNATGVGVDNRIVVPNQGVNGMNGVQVLERNLAQGNSGSSSQWVQYRTRDNGYNHGPLILDASAALPFQPILSVYPSMPWPSNHFVNYDAWVSTLGAAGQSWKESGDATRRLYIEPSGKITHFDGTTNAKVLSQFYGGYLDGYDSAQTRRIQFDKDGAFRLWNSSGEQVGILRHNAGTTFGGWTISGFKTNELAGFTFGQTLANVTNSLAHYAFPGMDWLAGTAGVSSNYVYVSQGIYGPIHPHGYTQNRFGMFVDANDPSAFGSAGYVIAMPKSWMDFQIRLGATTSPSLQLDQSTTAGETRLLIWDAATGGPVRVMHHPTARLFHSGTLHTNIATLVSNATVAGLSFLTAANYTAMQALLGLGSMAFINDAPADGQTYGRKNNAWVTNAPGGSTYTNFWYDLTNSIRAGANQTITLDTTNRTATWSASGGGGSTNGTSVSVNAGGALSALNLQSSARVSIALSGGSNGIPDIVAGSLTTNHIESGSAAYFLARANHTGTQLLSTISDAGAMASRNDAPTNGQVYARQDGAWVVVTNSGSGGGSTTISNLMQRVGWAEWETVMDWRASPATGVVQNASQGGSITAVYSPSSTSNGVAGMPPFPDSPFGIRAMRVNLAGSGITSNSVFVLKKLSLQTTNVFSSSYTNSGWTSADYLILHGGLVSTNVPLLLDVDPGYSTITLGTGLDLHTWTNRFRMDVFAVSDVTVSGGSGGGTTNLVSTTTNGLVPAITASNAVFAASSTGTPEWIPRHTRTLASFRSYQGEPPSANWARMSTRNSIGTMLFDHTTEQSLRFRWLVPENFPSTQTNVTVILQWTTSATSGVARWGAQNMDLQGDIDSDSFDTAVEGNTTTSSTAGTVMVTTLSSVSLDGAVAGDWVWTRVYRDSSDAADTINSNDLELHAVEVRW